MSDNDLYYSKIGKVHTAQEEEANALLADGWVLIGPTNIPVVTHQKEGGDIVTTTPAFNLGLRRNDIAQPAAKTSAPATNPRPPQYYNWLTESHGRRAPRIRISPGHGQLQRTPINTHCLRKLST